MVVTDKTAGPPVPLPGKRHILLVDDDKTFNEAVGQLLRRAGFEVTQATDFRVALEVLEAEGQIDLLISDIVMPSSVNGIALSRMARLRRRDLKVLYLTGYNIPGIENEALGPDSAEAHRRRPTAPRDRTGACSGVGIRVMPPFLGMITFRATGGSPGDPQRPIVSGTDRIRDWTVASAPSRTRRPMSASATCAERTAPSCQPVMYDMCSPANR